MNVNVLENDGNIREMVKDRDMDISNVDIAIYAFFELAVDRCENFFLVAKKQRCANK